jgi:hypothetical protein
VGLHFPARVMSIPPPNTVPTAASRSQLDAEHARSARSQAAVAIGATLAALLSGKIAAWFIRIVPQLELLLAFTFILAVIFNVLSAFAAKRFYWNDRRLDGFEQFILAVLDFLALLLAFVGVQYAAEFLSNLFDRDGLPALPVLILCVAVVIFVALGFVPFVRADLLAPQPEEASRAPESALATTKKVNDHVDLDSSSSSSSASFSMVTPSTLRENEMREWVGRADD